MINLLSKPIEELNFSINIINKNVLTVVKNIGEYSFMFSLITGLSAGITKYLVTVPLKLFFEII